MRELAGDSLLAGRSLFLEEVESTMEVARERWDGEPLLVVAEVQRAGRGREGRTWHSPGGVNLHFTAALPFARPGPALPAFTLACGVAIHGAVEELAGLQLGLKWPNDLLSGGRKLAGVLCECVGDVVLVGVGLNVNATSFPPELGEIATSMRLESGRVFEREEVLVRVCSSIEGAAGVYAREGFGAFVEEYRARCGLWGRSCRVGELSGRMRTVDEGGGLVLELGDGSEATVGSGHVELLD